MTATVACVRWGNKYPAYYVTRLQSMVKRHLSVPHQFLCLTDQAPIDGVQCRALPASLPTWWSKIGLFQPGVFSGDVIYLDLDVVITGGIDRLADITVGSLTTLDDFGYPLRKPRPVSGELLRQLGGPGTINSSVMAWRADTCCDVWHRFDAAVMSRLHGDQNWITQVLWPNRVVLIDGIAESYKYTSRHAAAPTSPIVVFHGDPKPHEASEPWVSANWW